MTGDEKFEKIDAALNLLLEKYPESFVSWKQLLLLAGGYAVAIILAVWTIVGERIEYSLASEFSEFSSNLAEENAKWMRSVEESLASTVKANFSEIEDGLSRTAIRLEKTAGELEEAYLFSSNKFPLYSVTASKNDISDPEVTDALRKAIAGQDISVADFPQSDVQISIPIWGGAGRSGQVIEYGGKSGVFYPLER